MRILAAILSLSIASSCADPSPKLTAAERAEGAAVMAKLRIGQLSAGIYSDGTFCGSRAELAAVVMDGRQSGRPLSSVMQRVAGAKDTPPAVREDARAMVLDAYSRPRFSTPAYQKRAVVEFSNEYYRSCAA